MIVALSKMEVVDEYQLGVQPTIVGSGLPLFKNITKRIDLKLLKTKTFGCGAVFFTVRRQKGVQGPKSEVQIS